MPKNEAFDDIEDFEGSRSPDHGAERAPD